uniref:Secreted protein n=1 Tax=Triticum urartu TaxID=4572 RepID=A0A8R7UYU0_TRIUA
MKLCDHLIFLCLILPITSASTRPEWLLREHQLISGGLGTVNGQGRPASTGVEEEVVCLLVLRVFKYCSIR